MSKAREVLSSVRQTGVLEPGERVLVMLSGGADSVCLAHVATTLLGAGAVAALHVNHALRAEADADERFCADLCERLGIPLDVERAPIRDAGNLEALARDARYAAAERVRAARALDRIATGHTASDQVETVLYRLACSPGRRALLGMELRRGRLVRPLLRVTRSDVRSYCEESGLPWREDESNLDRRFARNRLRLDVVPALREVHPAAEANVVATVDQLREESELLDAAVSDALAELASAGPRPALDGRRLAELQPGLRRLVLRRLAEQAAGEALPLSTERVREIEELALRGGSASIDLGAGVRVTSEYGVLRFHRPEAPREPAAVRLGVPGRCRFGEWELVCALERERASAGPAPGSPDEAVLDAAKLADELVVRPWRHGDRIRPLGLAGSKSLQDVFTDRKVPRALRGSLPVVESAGEIVWVAGVAIADRFRATDDTGQAARLRARHTS